jgi:hypothetical protein
MAPKKEYDPETVYAKKAFTKNIWLIKFQPMRVPDVFRSVLKLW